MNFKESGEGHYDNVETGIIITSGPDQRKAPFSYHRSGLRTEEDPCRVEHAYAWDRKGLTYQHIPFLLTTL